MHFKVSIIVPIYNVEKHLPRCVESLINQTLKNIEIILVDDESPDNCAVLCDKYAENDCRIKVVHKKNEGLGYARNSGLSVATGEYVAFVDSDDYVDIDAFEKLYDVAKKENVDIVWADKYNEKSNGDIMNKLDYSPIRPGKYQKEEVLEGLLYPQFGMLPHEGGNKYVSCSSCTNLYKMSVIRNNQIWFDSERECISEDMFFNLKFLINAQSAYVIHYKYYHYVVNDKSLTHVYRADRFDKEIIFYKECINRLEKLEIYDICKVRLQRHLLIRARKCIKREFLDNPDIRGAFHNVKSILKTQELQEIFDKYDYHNMPIKYKVVYILMKHKCVYTLKLISNKM